VVSAGRDLGIPAEDVERDPGGAVVAMAVHERCGQDDPHGRPMSRRRWIMFSITRRHQEWVVLEDDELVSVHPTREEAERVVIWLMRHAEGSSAQQIQRSSAPDLVMHRLGP
jgi:hypothetical protein